MDRISFLPNQINSIPNVSGLYFFYNKQELLYIGKAKFLKNRINEHYKQCGIVTQSILYLVNILGKEIKNINPVLMWTDTILNSQRIDIKMKNITEIKIELIPHNYTRVKEKEQIKLEKPKLNYEIIAFDDLNTLYRICNKIDGLLVKEAW